MRKKMREGVSLYAFLVAMSDIAVCAMRLERNMTQDERMALITVLVLGAVALMVTAIMFFGARNDRLWSLATGLFSVVFAAMLTIPMIFVTSAITILSGTLALFLMLAGVITLLGVVLAVLEIE